MECVKNCGACCGCVPFKKKDILKLSGKEKKKLAKKRDMSFGEIKDKNDIAKLRFLYNENDINYFSSDKFDGYCVFLDSEKQCSIYEKRPQICRDFGEIEQLKCPIL